jgi:hypothetical protein
MTGVFVIHVRGGAVVVGPRVRVTCSSKEGGIMNSVEDLDVFKLAHQFALKTGL